MQPAEDAELIDTTELEVDDVVGRIEELVRARSLAASVSGPDIAWAIGRVYDGLADTRWSHASAHVRRRARPDDRAASSTRSTTCTGSTSR